MVFETPASDSYFPSFEAVELAEWGVGSVHRSHWACWHVHGIHLIQMTHGLLRVHSIHSISNWVHSIHCIANIHRIGMIHGFDAVHRIVNSLRHSLLWILLHSLLWILLTSIFGEFHSLGREVFELVHFLLHLTVLFQSILVLYGIIVLGLTLGKPWEIIIILILFNPGLFQVGSFPLLELVAFLLVVEETSFPLLDDSLQLYWGYDPSDSFQLMSDGEPHIVLGVNAFDLIQRLWQNHWDLLEHWVTVLGER